MGRAPSPVAQEYLLGHSHAANTHENKLIAHPTRTHPTRHTHTHTHSPPTARRVEAVVREGGAYVRFHTNSMKVDDVSEVIISYLKEHQTRNLLIRRPIRSNVVLGEPFKNDMPIFPSRKVCVRVRACACVCCVRACSCGVSILFLVLVPESMGTTLRFASPVAASPLQIHPCLCRKHLRHTTPTTINIHTN